MLQAVDIDRIVKMAAQRIVRNAPLASVHSGPAIAADGKDALRIVLVFADDFNPALEGDVGLDTLIGVRNALIEAGEERFPIIDFSTEHEEEQGVGPQS